MVCYQTVTWKSQFAEFDSAPKNDRREISKSDIRDEHGLVLAILQHVREYSRDEHGLVLALLQHVSAYSRDEDGLVLALLQHVSVYSRDEHGLVFALLQHVGVGVVGDGVEMRRHLGATLATVLLHHRHLVDW